MHYLQLRILLLSDTIPIYGFLHPVIAGEGKLGFKFCLITKIVHFHLRYIYNIVDKEATNSLDSENGLDNW